MKPVDRLQFLETALASSTDGVVIVDARGEVVFANDAGKALLPRPPAGSPAGAARPAGLRYSDGRPVPPGEPTALERALRGENVADLELLLGKQDGEEACVSVTANPVRDDRDEVIGAVATVRDITGHKCAAEALRQSEARLRALVTAMSDVVLVMDAQGRYLEIAPTSPQLLYKPATDLLGKTVHEVFPAPHADLFVDHIRRALATRATTNLEYNLQIGDHEVWFTAAISPLGEDTVVFVARDITERKRAEEALRAGEARYRGLWNAVEAGIVVYDGDGHVVEANERAQEMLGPLIHRESAPTQSAPGWRALDEHGAPLPRELRPGLVALRTGRRLDEIVGVVRPSEEVRWLLVDAVPTRDPDTGSVVGAVVALVDFTERKRAEDQLMHLTAERAAVFRSIPDLLLRLDAGGTVLDCMGGEPADILVAPEACLGRRLRDALPADVGPQVEETALRVIGSAVPEAIEVNLERPTGERHFEVRLFPMAQRQALVMARDVTESRRAAAERERLLKEVDRQYRRFRAIFDNAPAGIVVLRGAEFALELANPVVVAWEGSQAPETIGKPLAEAWPLVAPQLRPTLESVLSTGQPQGLVDAPMLVRRPPTMVAEPRYFTLTAVPLGLEEEAPTIMVLFVDTTDYVAARQGIEQLATAAQQQAARVRGILDNMVDGVFACDAEGRINLVNEAGARLFGLSDLREVGHLLAEGAEQLHFRHLDGRPYARDELPLARALAGEVIKGEGMIARNQASQRDVYVRGSASPVLDEAGRIAGAVAVARDVTELTELDRLKGQFIQVAAHELKTPVTIMKGYAQALLRSGATGGTAQAKMLKAIDRGADRIERIINDLLDISKMQAGRLELASERIDLAQLVGGVTGRMALTTTKHRIRLAEAQPVFVRGDPDRLEQVVAHLLDNAIRYSPRGGDVDVAVTAHGDEAIVSVRDQGVGIPAGKQARIFQPFYRAHARTPFDYGGMGVGLHISQEIVQRHGGRIRFTSEEGRGSEFQFSLPLADR